jgi:hypothetical protein
MEARMNSLPTTAEIRRQLGEKGFISARAARAAMAAVADAEEPVVVPSQTTIHKILNDDTCRLREDTLRVFQVLLSRV